MGTYTGKNAVVEAGATPVTVGKVKSISYNGSVETQEDEYLGEAGVDVTVGNERWEGSITYHHDASDTGQQELTLGATVAIIVYPEGKGSSKPQVDFNAIITEDPNSLEPNAKVEKTVAFKIQGIPVKSTQV